MMADGWLDWAARVPGWAGAVRGIDYSWARPGGKAIREAGFAFVVRYIDHPGAGGKGLTQDELDDLRGSGLAVVLVFESTAGRALEGYDAGVIDGHTAGTELAALGFPVHLPIYFAVDFDAQWGQFDRIDDYLRGCASVLGVKRVGVYGEYDVVRHCQEAGTATYLWQTYAWSGGKRFEGNHIYQYLNGQTLNGGAVDYNEACGGDYGQWPAEGGLSMEDHELLKALFKALTGGDMAILEEWIGRGNSLLLGYAIEQERLSGHIADHARGIAGPIPEHEHEGGRVKRP